MIVLAVLAIIMLILGFIGVILFVTRVLLKNSDGGCLSTLLFLLFLGGYIGAIVGVCYEGYGTLGALVIPVGIILGIIAIKAKKSDTSSSSNYSSGNSYVSSSSYSSNAGDNKCGSCLYWKSRGECFCQESPYNNDDRMATDDACGCWRKSPIGRST